MLSNILIIRFSAFGDVAMTLPAVYSVAKAHPHKNFYILTSKSFETLFINQLSNIKVIGVDLKQYKGVRGLRQLAKEVNLKYKIDAVADLHNVLRSKVLRSYFKLRNKRVEYINKERTKKNAIVKKRAPLTPLKHSIDRYKEVFSKLGLPSEMSFTSYFENQSRSVSQLNGLYFNTSKTNIGIAPFAMHTEKMYPIHKMEEVVRTLSENNNTHIYLFGGGQKEQEKLEEWDKKYPNVTSVVGKLTLHQELLLISYLSAVVTMDSANMHLASLVNTPVVSVWGATHPYLGFYGFKQLSNNAVQLNNLDCRPCSVFGNTPCWRGDHACMNGIAPQSIINKLEIVLHENVSQSQQIHQ